ncbi:DUF3800 domain-containing protein [Coleofasciculus sp. E1-EBD-02]|uniref:DUF3800 domain-containing protein n=1 Tax=Coleofasciculus sp. E1-EBD-02 TaxID=3068481 RepID=UPI0032F6FE02
MILFYIDEGGTGWKDTQTNFFFLVSFAIPAQNWFQMDSIILSFKKGILSGGQLENWELKGRDIWQGLGKFKKVKREYRMQVFLQISEILNQLPCHILAIQVDKKGLRDSGESIKDDTELYQFAFRELLEKIDAFLKQYNETGILFMDSRSTQHTAVQDGRLIRAYRDWVNARKEPSSFVELPVFGFSEFYTGLQLADYVTYLIDRTSKESAASGRSELQVAFNLLKPKLDLSKMPCK